MVSMQKVVGVLSCSFLLCLGLSNAVQAEHAPGPSDVMKTDSVTDKQGFQSDDDKQKNVDNEKGSNRTDGAKTIQGRTDPRRRRQLFRQGEGRQGSTFTHR